MCHNIMLHSVLHMHLLGGNHLKPLQTIANLGPFFYRASRLGLNGLVKNSRNSSSDCEFSNEEKLRCIENLKKFRIQQRKTSSKLRNAAVLIPLCCARGELSLLYTLRKQDLKIHKGQISFPGGKQDSKDTTLENTALRETEEEIGISRNAIDVWGTGNFVAGREFNVLPVVGFIHNYNIDSLSPNPSEVELVFTIPLTHFCNPLNSRYTQFRLEDDKGFVMPVYVNVKPNKENVKIWGITAMITHLFLSALIPQTYVHRLSVIKTIR